MNKLNKDERGVTLLELLIVVGMVGLIASAITSTAFQVFNLSTRASNRMTAIRQVQQAGYWLSRDVWMAQSVTEGPSAGFPLTLNWTEGTRVHRVVYTLELAPGGVNDLWRKHTVYVNSIPNPTTVTLVAQYIMPAGDGTSCDWNSITRTLDFRVTATLGGQTEARTYLIDPKAGP